MEVASTAPNATAESTARPRLSEESGGSGSRSSQPHKRMRVGPVLSCISGEKKVQKAQSKKIDKILADDFKRSQRIVQILLLGPGESGKSTILKQMRIIHSVNFNEAERKEQVKRIHSNIRVAITSLINAMGRLQLGFEKAENTQHAELLTTYFDRLDRLDNCEISQEIFDVIESLWYDAGIRECYKRLIKVEQSTGKYFLDRLKTVRQETYLPSDEDLIRCRVMTTGISTTNCEVSYRGSKIPLELFDVGGQRGERRRWIQVFSRVNAILFLIDASSFDQTCVEDSEKNRLLDAIELFDDIWNNRFLNEVGIILFLNKIDLLNEKISKHQVSFEDAFVSQLASDHPYAEYFRQNPYETYEVSSSERKDFAKQFANIQYCVNSTDDRRDASSSKGQSELRDIKRGSPSLSRASSARNRTGTMTVERGPPQETTKAAVYMKEIFVQIMRGNLTRGERPRHIKHPFGCQTFYTCAIDTNNIKHVMEACNDFFIINAPLPGLSPTG